MKKAAARVYQQGYMLLFVDPWTISGVESEMATISGSNTRVHQTDCGKKLWRPSFLPRQGQTLSFTGELIQTACQNARDIAEAEAEAALNSYCPIHLFENIYTMKEFWKRCAISEYHDSNL